MRKEKTVIIRENDKELKFTVRAMSATKGFRFGVKVAKAFAQMQSESYTYDSKNSTVLTVLMNNFASLNLEMTNEIMEEALSCVSFASPVGVRVCTSDVLDEIVEDPEHVWELLSASLEINLNFIIRRLPEDFLKKTHGEIEQVAKILQTSTKA